MRYWWQEGEYKRAERGGRASRLWRHRERERERVDAWWGRDIEGVKGNGFMEVVWAPEGSQGDQATDPKEPGYGAANQTSSSLW